MKKYQSWGRYPAVKPAKIQPVYWRDELPDLSAFSETVLPYGCGRSYGDSCINDAGVLLDISGMNRFLDLDQTTGILKCEAGVTLADILDIGVPRGWFLPVSPGTKYVTVGGAIANDVHGKNHHLTGTFGCHVLRFELVRSDGSRLICSPTENVDLFKATIGGLGLTGLITWAEIRLKPVQNAYIDEELIRFSNLEEFFVIAAESDKDFEFTMSWVDVLAKGKSLGRGIFMRGNHNRSIYRPALPVNKQLPVEPPFNASSNLLNGLTMTAFNQAYFHKQLKKQVIKTVPYDPFFYPLDMVNNWNRMYGKFGPLQYQCVVPFADGHEAIREIITRISAAGEGSFLAVLKVFGKVESPGMLSFPRPGVTLALDFPFHGEKTLHLMDDLDKVVLASGGAGYPAKDSRMAPSTFQHYYPQWQEFSHFIDPKFSSSFWRRVSPALQKD